MLNMAHPILVCCTPEVHHGLLLLSSYYRTEFLTTSNSYFPYRVIQDGKVFPRDRLFQSVDFPRVIADEIMFTYVVGHLPYCDNTKFLDNLETRSSSFTEMNIIR